MPCSILLNYHPWTSAAGYRALPERELLLGLHSSGPKRRSSMRPAPRPEPEGLARPPDHGRRRNRENHTLKVIEAASGRLAGLEVDIVIALASRSNERRAGSSTPSAGGEAAPRTARARGIDRARRCRDQRWRHHLLRACRCPRAGGAVAVEPHQVLWIESLERAGTLLRFDRDGEMDVSVIDRLLGDGALRAAMADACAKLMPGSGAPGIAARVQRLLRPAGRGVVSMFAYIPARGGSQRLPRKNIRFLA